MVYETCKYRSKPSGIQQKGPSVRHYNIKNFAKTPFNYKGVCPVVNGSS